MDEFSFVPGSDSGKSTESQKESWSVAQGTNNGRPMFVRINTGLKLLAGKPPYDHRLGVAIPLQAPNQHGLPSKEESQQLNGIEDALRAAVLSSEKTHLAVVITTNGFREFVFYTSVPRDIVITMERFRKEVTSHQIQFHVKPDTTWEVYRDFAK
jgi:Family of unknown function (DUF695)